jgi:hypothetical protein
MSPNRAKGFKRFIVSGNAEPLGRTESYCLAMPTKSNRPADIVNVVPMTAEESAVLKKLAIDAFEQEAFSPDLTQAEARRRIATLTAKLALLDEPPHTL